uniref:Uncharacterized protein n=2 Tax=Fagus sylvatica TaxID=28930 RepID=A0A2N9EN68_FAGSY
MGSPKATDLERELAYLWPDLLGIGKEIGPPAWLLREMACLRSFSLWTAKSRYGSRTHLIPALMNVRIWWKRCGSLAVWEFGGVIRRDVGTEDTEQIRREKKGGVMESGDASATPIEANATQAEAPISQPESTCTQHVGSTPDNPYFHLQDEGYNTHFHKQQTSGGMRSLDASDFYDCRIANVRDVLSKLYEHYSCVHLPNVEVESSSEKSTTTMDVDVSETNPYEIVDSQLDLYLEAE